MQTIDYSQLIGQINLFAYGKLLATGIGIFVLVYWLYKKVPALIKTLFVASIGLMIYAYYDFISGYYYLVVLGIYAFIGLGVLATSGFVAKIALYTFDDSLALKKIARNVGFFYALSFVFIYAFGVNLLLYPITDDYFTYIAPIFGLLIVSVIGDLFDMEKLYQELRDLIAKIQEEKAFFTLEELYQQFNIEGKRYKFKAFIDELVQGFEYNGEVASINLYGTAFYFEPKHLQQLIDKMESIAKTADKISFKEAILQASKIIELPPTHLEDFLKASENVNKYTFDDGAYFIHNVNLDNFALCSSCGKARDKDSTNDIEGEWFCSSLCEKTENVCLQISEDLNPVILNGESYEAYKERFIKNLSNTTSIATTTLGVAEVWAKNFKTLQNADTGHGFAAEIMNTEIDNNDFINRTKGLLRNTEKFPSLDRKAEILGDDNAPNGVDRLVDGIEIQTKYYKTAARSIGAGFDNKGNGNYRYYNKEGKPMQLEVPKDQYEQAVKVMEDKIKQGKVPGVTDPKEAKNIVRKGSVTLQEAKNYSKFCTKESLKYDARNGTVVAMVAFGVSFIINTSLCYYREKDIKKALKESFIIGIKTGGKAFAIYMVGAQMQRIPAVNHFLQQVINFNFNGNAVGRALAEVGKKGASSAGKGAVNSAANSALRGTIVVAAATMAVTSSVEVIQMMRGQISGMQCVKNIAVNAGGIAGGAAGALAGAAALSFIPGVGTIIGGLAGGLLGGMGGGAMLKKLMDKFIEDDLAKKQRVFFEHIITLSVLFKLSKDEGAEFSTIVNKIVQDDADFFGKKFEVKQMLPYANSILKPIVVAIVSQRPKLPNYTFDRDEIIDVAYEVINEAS